jgi:hypothetical protein
MSLSWQITYNPGETVIREGEKGELFYVIKEGEGIVTVSKGSMTGNRSGQKKVRPIASAQTTHRHQGLSCDRPVPSLLFAHILRSSLYLSSIKLICLSPSMKLIT